MRPQPISDGAKGPARAGAHGVFCFPGGVVGRREGADRDGSGVGVGVGVGVPTRGGRVVVVAVTRGVGTPTGGVDTGANDTSGWGCPDNDGPPLIDPDGLGRRIPGGDQSEGSPTEDTEATTTSTLRNAATAPPLHQARARVRRSRWPDASTKTGADGPG